MRLKKIQNPKGSRNKRKRLKCGSWEPPTDMQKTMEKPLQFFAVGTKGYQSKIIFHPQNLGTNSKKKKKNTESPELQSQSITTHA